ncbi:MAG TPA: ABC transporter ATP-binding protein [bacterium]|nr:ABC transporter ATP-binding protein [bacterium]
MIAIRDLRKRFGAITALDGITASITRGEFAVLLGSNGAGKTTLLRCLMGLLAFEGTIEIGGCDVVRDGKGARRLIGYVPQRPSFPQDLNCDEVLSLFALLRGLPSGDASWLARVGLQAHASTAVRTLSGGMKQRLALAVALQADPAVILFDEPAAHLDAQARRGLHRDLDALAGAGHTVVMATHLAGEPLKVAARALVLERGRLAYNGPPDGMGSAVQQRVVFTMNGVGRQELCAVLGGLPGVHITQTPAAVVASTRAGHAFDLLAAVAAAGVHPPGVHLEEPSIDARLLPGIAAEERDS